MTGLELPTRQGVTAMELSIQQGDLAYAVGKAFGSVSAKSPMPLLSCLLIEAVAKIFFFAWKKYSTSSLDIMIL